jgi:uroporphyrinogen-III synthase
VVRSTESPARILITRSEPGAATLAAALSRAGFAPLVFPVLEIRPLDPGPGRNSIAQLDRFDQVIFVSGHAVTFGMQLIDACWRERPHGITWIAVGAATAAALARYGIVAIVPEDQSSEGILALPQTQAVAGRRILLVAGQGGRAELSAGLTQRGARVELLELYRRQPVAPEAASTLQQERHRIAAVVISSADGGRAFAALWRAIGGSGDVPLIAPSARVARVLRELQFGCVVESAGAGPDAVVDTARKLMGNSDE